VCGGSRVGLQLRCAQFKATASKPSALCFGEEEHRASNSTPPSRWIDVHPAQFHRFRTCPLQTEHPDDFVGSLCDDPEATATLAVIRGNPRHFFDQRSGDISLEHIA
jgi:hypothetical protein